MSARRVGTLLTKDLGLGPRSPLVLWAVVVPIVMTVLIRGVFGSLFAAEPRLGIVDEGGSALVAEALALDGVDVRLVDDQAVLRQQVEANDLDAGLILPAGFDDAVRAGDRPELALFVGGESLASNRILLAVTALDLVRGLEERTPPVEVELVTLGEGSVNLEARMLPLLVIIAVSLAGGMIPAAGLVEEKEKGTLDALLVTPVTMRDVFIAKGLLGWVLAILAGTVTLAVNGVLTVEPGVTLPAIALGALMMVLIGLLLGAWAPDTNTLFAAWKGGGMVLFFPVVFFVWPGLPAWIARFGPTYYFLRPTYAATVEQATLSDVWGDLAIAALLCVALLPAVAGAGRWLERRRGAGAATSTSRLPDPEEAPTRV